MRKSLAAWVVFPLLAALCACQSDRLSLPSQEAGSYAPMPGYSPSQDQGRPLPLEAGQQTRPPQPISPGTDRRDGDPLPGTYASAREKIETARSTDPGLYKPSGSESLASAEVKCAELSRRASTRGVSVLMIAFEGLISYDSPGTSAAYRYQLYRAADDERAEKPASVPLVFGGGGYILHELILPLVDRYGGGFEFLVFRHYEQDSDDSVPAVCAKTWLAGAPGRRLVIIGHSAGGGAASQLARSLQRARVWVDLVVTIDSVWTGGRAENVRRWENYHNAYPEVPGADVNLYIPRDHFNIPGSPEIVESVSRHIGAMIGVPTS